jgi:LPS sulfotransferase NodH
MNIKSEYAKKRAEYLLSQMAPESDIALNGMPSQRYCIASTPRSGSTLISRMLLSSQLAGDPKEYLSPLLIQAWHKINQRNISFSNYIKELENRRTSKNGFFGIKIHGRHLEELSKKTSFKSVISILENFDKFIFVSRKDKISQAISYHIARSTGIFHHDQEHWLEEFDIPQPKFNAVQMLNHLSDILREEKIWEELLNKINKPIYKISYEDLVKDYSTKSKEIFDFLGISINVIPEMPTKQMKKEFSSEYKTLLLEEIGLNSMANTKHTS